MYGLENMEVSVLEQTVETFLTIGNVHERYANTAITVLQFTYMQQIAFSYECRGGLSTYVKPTEDSSYCFFLSVLKKEASLKLHCYWRCRFRSFYIRVSSSA
jgi:hypothetical protein